MFFRFNSSVLLLLEQTKLPKTKLAKQIGVHFMTFKNVLLGKPMSFNTTVKFIRYFQKYHGWKKGEWKENLVQVYISKPVIAKEHLYFTEDC